MSTVGGFFKTFRDAVLIADRVDRLGEHCKTLMTDVRDHEHRLIRLETMVEMTARMSPRGGGQPKLGKD